MPTCLAPRHGHAVHDDGVHEEECEGDQPTRPVDEDVREVGTQDTGRLELARKKN